MKSHAWIPALAISLATFPLLAQAQNNATAETKPPLVSGLDKRLMDASADPCANFFQYSCGNFPKLYPIPADQSTHGTFDMVFNYTAYTLHSLLDKFAGDNPSRTPNEQK